MTLIIVDSGCVFRTLAFVERATVNPQVSLLNLTFEADIPSDVIWSLIDGKHIVSLPHHVDRVDDCLDEKIDGGTEDLFDASEDNTGKEDGGERVDIILSRPKCGF